MKKVKSFSNIWRLEKILYGVEDIRFPVPITYSQAVWIIGTLFFMILFGHLPPFLFISNPLIKYLVFPIAVAWFMSQKSLDGKKPYRFLISVLTYYLHPRVTYGDKPVKLEKEKVKQEITYVRSDVVSVSN